MAVAGVLVVRRDAGNQELQADGVPIADAARILRTIEGQVGQRVTTLRAVGDETSVSNDGVTCWFAERDEDGDPDDVAWCGPLTFADSSCSRWTSRTE